MSDHSSAQLQAVGEIKRGLVVSLGWVGGGVVVPGTGEAGLGEIQVLETTVYAIDTRAGHSQAESEVVEETA